MSSVKNSPTATPSIQYAVALDPKEPYTPYGQTFEFWRYKGQEAMLAGPYETGKTYGALQKLNALCLKYPGVVCLLARKQYRALVNSAFQTFARKVLPFPPGHRLCPVEVFGGGRPEWIQYPNGSTIVTSGLDIPEKVLSAEYDFGFVPQAEELSLHDWEQLLSRMTGRAGNSPYPQLMGDCNPGPPHHWILKRRSLKVFHTVHQDNPMLYDHEKHTWTEQGERTMSVLQSMTGLRYKRGFLGLWAGAEGQVYDTFDEEIHVIDPFPIPPDWRRWRSVDFGYTHPFVCQWWAEDEDGRLYLYREIYHSQRIVSDHMHGVNGRPGILGLSVGEHFVDTICDHDAGDRALMERDLFHTTIAANKSIKEGIDLVQERLRTQKDGRPRIFFFRDALVEEDESLATMYRPTCTIQEFTGYVWRKMDDKIVEATVKDEIPLRSDDHGLDAMRYMVMHLDGANRYGLPSFTSYIE